MVLIEMENGATMRAELYPEIAPKTVANFEKLVREGFYDGLTFIRAQEGFVIQGGKPSDEVEATMTPIPGEFFSNGFSKNTIEHAPGVISMARSQMPNSASSQFFIMHADAPHLDGSYAAFGKVVEGMDVVDEIAGIPTDYADRPVIDQRMKCVTVED